MFRRLGRPFLVLALFGPICLPASCFQRKCFFDFVADGGLVTGGCVGRRESISSVDLHLSTLTGIEQDTRVLTLAEQIIAAIPDRIKVLL